MRKLFVCAVALVAIALALGGAAAGPLPALTTAPTNFTCSVVDTSVQCSWDPLAGATKYSVDVVANYTLADGITTVSADFDFGTTLTSITIPLSAFPTDINQDTLTDTLNSLVLRVKGLNPPGKKNYDQATPFSSTIICSTGGSCGPAI
jgi:hypothetical protein